MFVNLRVLDGSFLSTLSLRRATWTARNRLLRRYHFYPRSPCGERLDTDNSIGGNSYISIHALLAESDPGKIWSTALA